MSGFAIQLESTNVDSHVCCQAPTCSGLNLVLVLVSITVVFLRGEAAGAVCGQRSPFPTIQALPGNPGKNEAPGVPGPKGEVGVDGINGVDGAAGPKGPVRPVGPQEIV